MLDKIEYFMKRGYDLKIGKFGDGYFIDLIKNHNFVVQERDSTLSDAIDKLYKIYVAGGYN